MRRPPEVLHRRAGKNQGLTASGAEIQRAGMPNLLPRVLWRHVSATGTDLVTILLLSGKASRGGRFHVPRRAR